MFRPNWPQCTVVMRLDKLSGIFCVDDAFSVESLCNLFLEDHLAPHLRSTSRSPPHCPGAGASIELIYMLLYFCHLTRAAR